MIGKPGQRARHSSGSIAVLSHRKADGTGWWIEGHGGLDDRVLESGDWELLPIVDGDELRGENLRLNRLLDQAVRSLRTALEAIEQSRE